MSYPWGPIYWNYLHMTTFQYPENPTLEDKRNYVRLIEIFIHTIPCNICKNDISDTIKISDLQRVLDSKSELIKYMWNIHNIVNKKLKKNQLSLKKCILSYKNILEGKSSSNLQYLIFLNRMKNYLIILLVIIVILLVIIYMINKCYIA